MSEAEAASAASRKCPICGRPTKPESLPFCSKRCADIDLHRWLSDGYRIPGPEDESAAREDDGG